MRIKTVLIGSLRDSLIEFLTRHRTTFAWSHSDMEGINAEIIAHHLNVLLEAKPFRQKRRTFAPKCNQAVAEEVRKLLAADFSREVHYPDWLSNVVMVKKANRSCPKDSFPLPRIDLLVDFTAEHEILSFLDAFFGYN